MEDTSADKSRLERRLLREKKARSQVEAMLESRSRELFEANQALQAANSQLDIEREFINRVLDTIPVGVVAFGHDGQIQSANPGFFWLFKTDASKTSAASLWARMPKELLDAIRRVLDSGHAMEQLDITVEDWDRRSVALEIIGTPLRLAAEERQGALVMLHDITKRKRVERELHSRATHDPLTGLANRAEIERRLDLRWERYAARPNEPFAVMFVDLDGFKPVNDSFGHAAGDQLLQRVAEQLCDCVRSSDTVGRIGGDEFAILLDRIGKIEEATLVGDRILTAIKTPFDVSGERVSISTSIGIATSDSECKSGEGILRCADEAMYAAKSRGRGQYVVCNTTST